MRDKKRHALKDKLEKKHAQEVLNYHNNKYGTSLEIKGKPEDVDPSSERKFNWDLVGYDIRTQEAIAIEVKQLTDEQKEQEYSVIYKALTEVEKRINNARVLQGTYLLLYQIQLNKAVIFKEKKNKKEFKDTVFQIICESAKPMKQGEQKLLTPFIKKRLSFQLPDFISITLCKLNVQGSQISKGSGIFPGGIIEFDQRGLEEFKKLVIHANEQLGQSKLKKTFLVIIEEGYMNKNLLVVTEAFSIIKPENYSNISNAYLIRGKKVTEIPLPNSI